MQIVKISAGWVLSPVIGGIVAALCWYPLKRFTLNSASPTTRIFQFLPSLAGITTGILALFILYKGLSPLNIDVPIYIALPCSIALGAILGVVIWKVVTPILKKRIDAELEGKPEEEKKDVELDEKHPDENSTQEQESNAEHDDVATSSTLEKQDVETDDQEQDRQIQLDNGAVLNDEVSEAPMIKEEQDRDHAEDLSVTISAPGKSDSEEQLQVTEKHAFNFLVIITSCCIATAHGANDISNAAGPLGAIVWTHLNQRLPDEQTHTAVWVTGITGTLCFVTNMSSSWTGCWVSYVGLQSDVNDRR
jgi:phosphate/sulfate permease